MNVPEIWGLLHASKDVLLNALDLASFILVTPELSRLIFSEDASTFLTLAVALLVATAFAIGILSGIILTIVFYLHLVIPQVTLEFFLPMVWLVMLIPFGMVGGAILMTGIAGISILTPFLMRYAFACGVIVFFVSRCIGLAVALDEMHSSHPGA